MAWRGAGASLSSIRRSSRGTPKWAAIRGRVSPRAFRLFPERMSRKSVSPPPISRLTALAVVPRSWMSSRIRSRLMDDMPPIVPARGKSPEGELPLDDGGNFPHPIRSCPSMTSSSAATHSVTPRGSLGLGSPRSCLVTPSRSRTLPLALWTLGFAVSGRLASILSCLNDAVRDWLCSMPRPCPAVLGLAPRISSGTSRERTNPVRQRPRPPSLTPRRRIRSPRLTPLSVQRATTRS